MRNSARTAVRRLPATKDAKDLIRTSNLLRHRSHAAQRAAASASARLNDLLRRSVEVCGK